MAGTSPAMTENGFPHIGLIVGNAELCGRLLEIAGEQRNSQKVWATVSTSAAILIHELCSAGDSERGSAHHDHEQNGGETRAPAPRYAHGLCGMGQTPHRHHPACGWTDGRA